AKLTATIIQWGSLVLKCTHAEDWKWSAVNWFNSSTNTSPLILWRNDSGGTVKVFAENKSIFDMDRINASCNLDICILEIKLLPRDNNKTIFCSYVDDLGNETMENITLNVTNAQATNVTSAPVPTGSTPIVSLNYQPPTIYGKNLTLTCQVHQDVGLDYVQFRRDGSNIIRITNTCGHSMESPLDKNKYSVSCNLTQRTFTLVKLVVNYSDPNSVWNCQVHSASGSNGTCVGSSDSCSSSLIRVTIEGPPCVQISPQSMSVYNVTEDTMNFTFTCNVIHAVPWPTSNSFSWRYQGSVIQGQKSISYTIPVVKRSHDGDYQCIASNPYGNGTSTKLTLDVQYAPQVSVSESEAIVEGKNLSVTCNVSANPKADVLWTKSGMNKIVSANLTIAKINRRQAGVYTCTANNSLYPTGQLPVTRTASKRLQIYVLHAPVVKVQPCYNANLFIVQLGQKNVVLNCTVNESYPQPFEFIWTQNGMVLQRERSSTYNITEVTRQTNGQWGCTGRNNYGTPNEDKMEIEVQYGPVVNISEDMTLNEGESLKVECTVDANPPAFEVFWSKDEDVVFLRNTTDLTFDRVSRHDSGTYRCTARNHIHPSGRNKEYINGTMTFYLNVKFEDASVLGVLVGGTLAAIVFLALVATTVFIVKLRGRSHRHFNLTGNCKFKAKGKCQ
ncbi:hypothetical protein ACJMK2_027389, partial [Sinanodonta woodiana]